NRAARLEAVEERITELEAEAEELVAVAEEKRAAAEQLVAEVTSLEAQQESQAEKFEKMIKDGEKRLEKLKEDDSKLAADIAAIHEAERKRKEKEERERKAAEAAAEEEARKKGNSSGSGSGGGSSSPSNPPAPSGSGGGGRTGALIPPISRALHVTSPYGYRAYPINAGRAMPDGGLLHNGVDLRSGCGERQFASAGGNVTAVRGAYGNGTHGNQVMINHGTIDGATYTTVYNHLSSFAVSQGQKVSQGQTIGYT